MKVAGVSLGVSAVSNEFLRLGVEVASHTEKRIPYRLPELQKGNSIEGSVVMCIQIDNPITVSELVERWKNIEVDGVKFGFHTIIEMFKAGEFNIYRKVAPSPRNGKMGYKCEEFTESMKEFMQFPDDGKNYILDLMEVEKYELNFKKEFTPSLSDVCARFMIPEDQLLRMLYNMAKGKEIPNPHSSSRGWSITTRLNDVSTAFFYDGDIESKMAELKAELVNERAEKENFRKKVEEFESNQKDFEIPDFDSLFGGVANERIASLYMDVLKGNENLSPDKLRIIRLIEDTKFMTSSEKKEAFLHYLGEENEDEDWLNEYPMCRKIRELHNNGLTRDEVRAELCKTYTVAQAGFLTKEDTNFQSDVAIKRQVYRGKKKVSPVTS